MFKIYNRLEFLYKRYKYKINIQFYHEHPDLLNKIWYLKFTQEHSILEVLSYI